MCGLIAHLNDVGVEAITNAPNGRNVPGRVGIVLKLSSQAVHNDPQSVAAVRRTPSPDLSYDRLYWQCLVRPCHEESEDGVFGRGEGQGGPIERDPPRKKVQ